MTNTQHIKQQLIEKILEQPTYLKTSGAYELCRQALGRLPRGTLGTLEVIIGCKKR